MRTTFWFGILKIISWEIVTEPVKKGYECHMNYSLFSHRIEFHEQYTRQKCEICALLLFRMHATSQVNNTCTPTCEEDL